jgi:hypothetical protein
MVSGRSVLDVADGFSPLLTQGGVLLALDELPRGCRAVAFGIRAHLLLAKCGHDKIVPTEWNALFESLKPDFALAVFGAAIRGLESSESSLPRHHSLSQDCAWMLAMGIGANRFFTENLATGHAAKDDPRDVRVIQVPQDPVHLVQVFLEQLGEYWSFIQLHHPDRINVL